MVRLIGKRLLFWLPMLFAVTIAVFSLQAIIPGDIARSIVGTNGTPEQYAQVRAQLGLDQPLWEQYADYLRGLAQGSLGNSLVNGEPVTAILNQRLPATLSIVVISTLLCAVSGIGIGVLSAVRGGWIATALDSLALIGLALPGFWVALMLVSMFAIALPLFPAIGYVPLSQGAGAWLHSLVLPVLALTVGWIASVAKQTRASMLESLSSPHVLTLAASGISRRSIIYKHALRDALSPIITVIGLFSVAALGAAVFVEVVFALPGLGSAAVHSVTERDIPVIEGIAIYFTVIVMVVNLVIEVLYGLLDPRVRVRA